MRSGTDRVDKALVIALVLFSASAVQSDFPRQSVDSIVLAGAYVSALIIGRRVLTRPGERKSFLSALMILSLTLTMLTTARWLPVAIEWMDLTNATSLPPLDLNLDAWPWGHRHDLEP